MSLKVIGVGLVVRAHTLFLTTNDDGSNYDARTIRLTHTIRYAFTTDMAFRAMFLAMRNVNVGFAHVIMRLEPGIDVNSCHVCEQ